MNGMLKAFLRVTSTLCLWGAPILGVLALAGSLATDFSFLRVVVVGMAGLYMAVIALLIGGVLRLLLSIDDRLERLEGNR